MKVIYTDLATEDIHRIMDYLEESFSIREVDAFLFRLDAFEHTVMHYPKGYMMFDSERHIRRAVLRRELSVFYRVNEDTIEVISVFDNRRQFPD